MLVCIGTSAALAQREPPPGDAPLTGTTILTGTPAPSAVRPVGTPEVIDFPATAMDVTIKLLLVLAIAYGCLALLRRFGPGGVWRQNTGQLQVLETTTLAPNRAVYLIRARDRELLLGVTPTAINTLAEWDVDQTPAHVPQPFADALATAHERTPNDAR